MIGVPPKVQALATAHRDRILASESLLAELTALGPEVRRKRLETIVRGFLEGDRLRPILSRAEEEQLLTLLVHDMAGNGPLEPLLNDPEVTEIMVNGPNQVWVERAGRLSLARGVTFPSDRHLRHVAQNMVAPLGRPLNDSNPLVDGRLPDGSRVNAIIPPLTLCGTCLTIRRFRAMPWTLPDLVQAGGLSQEMATLLHACIVARLNMVVAGGTSSGKTSLLSALGSLIPESERVITIEDVAELRFTHPHVVQMETKPANAEGSGDVSMRSLVRNALRMRPDRIILGEVRGPEVVDMTQAANTGHRGTLTTVHANSALDTLTRLEMLVMQSGIGLPVDVIQRTMLSVFEVLVYLARLDDGSRKVMGIYALNGQSGRLVPEPIYEFTQTGIWADGSVEGTHTGPLCRPEWLDAALAALARRQGHMQKTALPG